MVTYFTNLPSHSALEEKTTYFILCGKDPNYNKLRTIRACVFVHEKAYGPKLEPKAWEGNLAGYRDDSVAYRVYNPKTRRVVESRNSTFIEPPPYEIASPAILTTDNDSYRHI